MSERVVLLTSDFVVGPAQPPMAVVLVFLPDKQEFVTWWLTKPENNSVPPCTATGHYFHGTAKGLQEALNDYHERISRLCSNTNES